VIACIDDGPGGLAAARVADSLASRLGSRVLLATVQPTAPRVPGRVIADPATVGWGRRLIARVAQELDRPAELRVVFGEPAERLIALAQRESAEFVVISAPNHHSARTLLLGNVYLALAGAGPCPVVVVPRALDTLPAAHGPIVCGVDGSQPSLAAVRVAAELARLLDAPLRLVNVTVTPPDRAGPRAARPKLRDAADELSTHTAISLLVEHGSPAERLATVAARESAQLIVTGSRGCGSVASLLGSVSSRLAVQTTRPLVIVPSHP
jgi:nucleotide-binding universal stress UspA family protein